MSEYTFKQWDGKDEVWAQLTDIKKDGEDVAYAFSKDGARELCESLNQPERVKAQLSTIEREANNSLYFDDNSDYPSALWGILSTIDETYNDLWKDELNYIEAADCLVLPKRYAKRDATKELKEEI